MEFNESKCKVLHIGKNNPRYGNQMNGVNLEVSDKKKDVGVMIQEDLKPSKQCSTAAAKANSILGQMARSFTYRNKNGSHCTKPMSGPTLNTVFKPGIPG